MKKYIPLDFDEKGKAILGREKNTPTPNGTIPAIFIPGGSDENKQGLKSITISPAIETTPALDSLFPVYYENLTDTQKQDGVFLTANNETIQGQYTVTITPTSDWYIADGDVMEFQGKGEPITMEVDGSEGSLNANVMLANGTTQETTTQYFSVTIIIGD